MNLVFWRDKIGVSGQCRAAGFSYWKDQAMGGVFAAVQYRAALAHYAAS